MNLLLYFVFDTSFYLSSIRIYALMSSSSDLSVPPPIYAQQLARSPESDPQTDPQILIIPATDSLRFQQGFLGADGERASIEGELQLKGAHSDRWRMLSVVIRA